MEILNSGNVPALVTNIEVLQILRSRVTKRQEETDKQTAAGIIITPRQRREQKLYHRDYIEEGVYNFLENSACGGDHIDTKEKIPRLVRLLKKRPRPPQNGIYDDQNEQCNQKEEDEEGFGLNDAETLQVLNLIPRETVELHLMVEDISTRLSEERQADLLKMAAEAVIYSRTNDGDVDDWDGVEGDDNGMA